MSDSFKLDVTLRPKAQHPQPTYEETIRKVKENSLKGKEFPIETENGNISEELAYTKGVNQSLMAAAYERGTTPG